MDTSKLLDLDGNVPSFTGATVYTMFSPVSARIDGSLIYIERGKFPWVSIIVVVVLTTIVTSALITLHSRFPTKVDVTTVNLLLTGIGVLTLSCLVGFATLDFFEMQRNVVPITINLQTYEVRIPSLGLSIPASQIIELRSVTGVEKGASLASCDIRSELQLIFGLDSEPTVKCLVIAGTRITTAPFERILSVWKSRTGLAARHCADWEGIRSGWRKGLPWSK